MRTPARSMIFCTRVRDLAAALDQGAPVTALGSQVPEVSVRHKARTGEAELAQPCQPDAVGDIGLAALDLLDLPGVDQRRRDAGIGQRVERSFPVDAGPFHQRSVNLHLQQPGGHGRKSRRQGRELPGVVHRRAAGLCQANGGGDRHLICWVPGYVVQASYVID